MKLPVLGIIAVFCLQLGFIAFSALNRQIGALVSVNAVTTGSDYLQDAPQLPDGVDVFLAEDRPVSGRRLYARPELPTLVAATRVARIYAPKPVERAPIASRKPENIRARTEYPAAMPFDSESKNYQMSASIDSRHHKKSFFSKAVSIVKKPFDWAKAVAEKLK